METQAPAGPDPAGCPYPPAGQAAQHHPGFCPSLTDSDSSFQMLALLSEPSGGPAGVWGVETLQQPRRRRLQGSWGGSRGWHFGEAGRIPPTSCPFRLAHWGTPDQPRTVWALTPHLRVSASGAAGKLRRRVLSCALGVGGRTGEGGAGEDPCGRPGPDVYDGPSRETLTHVGGVSFTHNSAGLREHLPWGAVEAESKMLP